MFRTKSMEKLKKNKIMEYILRDYVYQENTERLHPINKNEEASISAIHSKFSQTI